MTEETKVERPKKCICPGSMRGHADTFSPLAMAGKDFRSEQTLAISKAGGLTASSPAAAERMVAQFAGDYQQCPIHPAVFWPIKA